MKAVIAEAARRELADAVDYYRAQDRALGDSFLDEFLAAVARIEEYHGCVATVEREHATLPPPSLSLRAHL